MAKISQYPLAAPALATDELLLRRGANNHRAPVSDLTDAAVAAFGTAIAGFPSAHPLAGADEFFLSRAGVNQKLSASNLAAALALGRRNAIIGGNFDTNPWQRGTAFPAIASGAFAADAIAWFQAGAMVVDADKHANASLCVDGTFMTHWLRVVVTTADAAVAAGDFSGWRHAIEGYDWALYAQRPFLLAFEHAFSKVGTYCVSLINSGLDRSIVFEFTQDVANAKEFEVFLVPASPADGTWDYTNGVGLNIRWAYSCGATFQTATTGAWQAGNFLATANQVNGMDAVANSFAIRRLSLDPGRIALPFEFRPVATELALCRRRLPVFNTQAADEIVGVGHNIAANGSRVMVPFDVEPRVKPTGITVSPAGNFSMLDSGGIKVVCTAVVLNGRTSRKAAVISTSVAAGLTAGHGTSLIADIHPSQILFTGAEI